MQEEHRSSFNSCVRRWVD